jgi:protein SCO1
MFIRSLLPSCAVVLLGVGAIGLATDGFRAFTEESARRLHVTERQPVMPVLTLEDMHGVDMSIGRHADATDKITLVEFIYTTCPTICQAAGDDFANLRDRFSRAGLGDRVRLLSVSFDPLRDTPELMRDYADIHGADGAIWTVARIQAQDINPMKRGFGLRVIPDGMGGYQHNAAIHLIDRSGRLSGIFDTADVDGVFNAVRSKL